MSSSRAPKNTTQKKNPVNPLVNEMLKVLHVLGEEKNDARNNKARESLRYPNLFKKISDVLNLTDDNGDLVVTEGQRNFISDLKSQLLIAAKLTIDPSQLPPVTHPKSDRINSQPVPLSELEAEIKTMPLQQTFTSEDLLTQLTFSATILESFTHPENFDGELTITIERYLETAKRIVLHYNFLMLNIAKLPWKADDACYRDIKSTHLNSIYEILEDHGWRMESNHALGLQPQNEKNYRRFLQTFSSDKANGEYDSPFGNIKLHTEALLEKIENLKLSVGNNNGKTVVEYVKPNANLFFSSNKSTTSSGSNKRKNPTPTNNTAPTGPTQ